MSLSRFVACVLVAVLAGLVLTLLVGIVTYGVSLELGYPPLDAHGYTALGGALIGASVTVAACALVGGLWAARERRGQARVFLPRDMIVVVAVAATLFLLWTPVGIPVAAGVGLATAIVFYGLGLAVGCRRAQTQAAEA